MAIRSGELNTRITIEQRSTAQDAAGEPKTDWERFAVCWAAVAATPGSEIWASGQRNGRVPTVFRMRHLEGVLPSMRVIDKDDRVFDIKSVVRNGRAEMLLITEELVEATP